MTPAEAHDVLVDDLGFCCGDMDAAYALVLQYLELSAKERSFYSLLEKTADEGRGVFFALLYWLDKADLLEHGGGITGSWLTPKGEQLLEAMRGKTWDDLEEAKRAADIAAMDNS